MAEATQSTMRATWEALRHDIHDVAETRGRWAAVRTATGAIATAAVTAPYLVGGLEATLATVGAKVYEVTNSMPAVATSVGATSGAIEAGLTLGLAHYMGKTRHTTEFFRRRRETQGQDDLGEVSEDVVAVQGVRRGIKERIRDMPLTLRQKVSGGAKTTALALSAGSPGVMIQRYVEQPEAGRASHRRAGLKTAGVLAAANTALGAGYAGMLHATSVLDRIQPGLTDHVVGTATNPLAWTGLFLYLNNMAEPVHATVRRAAAGLGRSLMFRGDELDYQRLSAVLEQNAELLKGMPRGVSVNGSTSESAHQEAVAIVELAPVPEDNETLSDKALNPQALEFLQTIYGRDTRLDGLTQQTATRLSDRLLHEYGVRYFDDPDEPMRIVEPLDNPEYVHAAAATAGYVAGETIPQIIERYSGYKDSLDVEIALSNVATHLRRQDADRRAIDPDEQFLESILEYYAGPPNEQFSRWHMTPLGESVVPIIERSQDTPEWQALQAELAKDIKDIEKQYLERLARDAEWAVCKYTASPEFQRAAARKNHTKPGEVFVIGPGDDDEDSRTLRHMASLVSAAVFARKDGNTFEEMQEHRDDEHDYHMLAVDQSGDHVRPMGVLYAKTQSEYSLPSVQDIWYEWHDPIREAMLKADLPDLRYHPNVIDVMALAVLPWYEHGGANLAVYNRFGVLCEVLGMEYITNVFDKGPADMLNHYGNAFQPYKGHIPINYKARIPNANSSLSRVARTKEWKEWLLANNPRAYRNFWSVDPAIGKRYQLPNLERFRKQPARVGAS
jgi:hypothetical protein